MISLSDIGGIFGFGSPRGPAQLTPCECINPWLPLNGSELYVRKIKNMKMEKNNHNSFIVTSD